MSKLDVSQLTEAQATLLMPLWARAQEYKTASPLLRDRKAAEIVETLDFDFDHFRQKRVPSADYCVRAVVLDQLVQEFLAQHPDATVVEFGVGLDTRFDRLDNGSVTWIELDFPHVMELRQRFFDRTDRRRMFSGSLTDPAWIPQVKAIGSGPRLFIAEGVLYFLTEDQVRNLLKQLVDQFPGSSFLFDAQSPWYLWFSNLRQPLSNASMKFSVGDPRQLTGCDSRLRVRRSIGFGDAPYYDEAMQRLSPFKRWARRLCPPVRGMFKIIQLEW